MTNKGQEKQELDASHAAGLTLAVLDAVARQPLLGGLCETVFAEHDTEGTGTVPAGALRAVCMGLGVRLSDAELAAAQSALDADGTGRVAFDAFCAWWRAQPAFAPLRRREGTLAALHGVLARFAALDTDGDGVIARADFALLHAALRATGGPFPAEQADWDDLDPAHTGHISFNAFVNWLLNRVQ